MSVDAKRFAVEWMRDVLVELRDVPIHIVDRRERPDCWRPQAAEASATYIRQSERWREPGFAAIVDFDRLGEPLHISLRNLVAHEYLHVVLESIEPEPEPAPDDDELPEIDLAAIRQLYSQVTTASPWFGHAADFSRLACHLWHRSIVAGRPLLSWHVLAGGPLYGLSPIERYRDSLGDEPERLIELPLAEVARISIPEPALKLFENDRRRWRAEHGCD